MKGSKHNTGHQYKRWPEAVVVALPGYIERIPDSPSGVPLPRVLYSSRQRRATPYISLLALAYHHLPQDPNYDRSTVILCLYALTDPLLSTRLLLVPVCGVVALP